MNIYLQGMRDRSMRSGTEVEREIKLTDWSMAETCPTSPLEYKYRVIFVLCEVQLGNKFRNFKVYMTQKIFSAYLKGLSK